VAAITSVPVPDRSLSRDASIWSSRASAAPPEGSSVPDASSNLAPSAVTIPAPPSVQATPPRPSTIRFARIRTAARMSSPTPRLVAVSGASVPPGSLVSPQAWADSTMAVPSSRANEAVTGWPVGPRTPSSTRRYPAASAASTVPSPPSATGTWVVVSPGLARPSPAATCAATWAAVSVPLNLSGAITTWLIGP